jgi:hypothetical protein
MSNDNLAECIPGAARQYREEPVVDSVPISIRQEFGWVRREIVNIVPRAPWTEAALGETNKQRLALLRRRESRLLQRYPELSRRA